MLKMAARRTPAVSTRSMVCTSQALASVAGNDILNAGGNAVDAAVCIAAVLSVIEPYSTGLGGDAFALYYDAKQKQVVGINGSGRAGSLCTVDFVKSSLGSTADKIPLQHGLSVTVPGAVQCWIDMLNAWGTLPLAQVLQPAISLAEQGFAVSDTTARTWRADVEHGRVDANSVFATTGMPTKPGQICRNRELAQTLRLIAQHGREGFYAGEVARKICEAVKQRGGGLEEADLSAHVSEFVLPVTLRYRDQVDVHECPPNGQGMVALMALDSFQRLTTSETLSAVRDSVELVHLQIECLKTAFADASKYVCDPQFTNFDFGSLLTDDRFVQSRLDRIQKGANEGAPQNTCDTVSFQVVDREGNSVSMVNSVYTGFGSGIVPQGLGLALQNRGCNFSLSADSVNCIAPGKRPYHTIIPGMATSAEDGSLVLSFTGMGGFAQPQNHLQLLVNVLDFGDDVQQAVDHARFCVMADGRVAVEEGGFTPEVLAELRSKHKHDVYEVTGLARAVVGRAQMVQRDTDTGVLFGGSDSRCDGMAVPGL